MENKKGDCFMKNILIALTARNQSADKNNPNLSNNRSYSDYVSFGGGIPVTVFVKSKEEAECIAERCDGLLITGGEDCIPASYHEENRGSFPIDEDLEKSDFLLYRAFRKMNKPILGICRGIQVIGVCEGAHLIQDIPSEYGVEHNQTKLTPPVPRDQFCHTVTFTPGTKLYQIFGESYEVNSFHHQSLASVPEGFTGSAYSKEGIIEGIEKDHVIAVQWHPERLMHDPCHLAVMKSWIKDITK